MMVVRKNLLVLCVQVNSNECFQPKISYIFYVCYSYFSKYKMMKNLVCHKAIHVFPKYLNYMNWRYYLEIYLQFDI